MQDPADGIVGVMGFTIARVQQGSYGNVSDVFAGACFTPVARSPQKNPSYATAPLQSSVPRHANGWLQSLVAPHSRYRYSPGDFHKFILPAVAFELTPRSRMLTDPLA